MRIEMLPNDAPVAPQTLQAVERAAAVARKVSMEALPPQAGRPRVMLAGPSAYILNERTIADADQRRVVVLAAAVIALIVLVLVRDVALTAFMVLTTLLTYGATLTLSSLFFVHAMGLPGLDWKVRLILFVIVMAVGQDYNIFLVARLREEVRSQARHGRYARQWCAPVCHQQLWNHHGGHTWFALGGPALTASATGLCPGIGRADRYLLCTPTAHSGLLHGDRQRAQRAAKLRARKPPRAPRKADLDAGRLLAGRCADEISGAVAPLRAWRRVSFKGGGHQDSRCPTPP
jgi:hypothetical protein